MVLSHKAARIISDIFVPPTFTLLSFIYLALIINTSSSQQIAVIASASLFGFLFPIFSFIGLRMKKKVSDNDAVIKEERTIPYVIGILFSLAAIIILLFFQTDLLIIYLWVCYIVNMIGMLIINKHWKISAHAIGASTPLGLLLFLNSILFPYVLILVLVICWARLRLKVHTPLQVAAGTLYGLVITYGQLQLYSRLFNVS